VRLQEWEGPEYFDEELALPAGREDRYVISARERIRQWFRDNPNRVVYQQQLCVLLERDYFHWITRRAVEELVAENRLISEAVSLRGEGKPLRVYRTRSNRNWRRQARTIAALVEEFSPGSPLGDSIGLHGELMLDAAMAAVGFIPVVKNVTEWNGISWIETKKNLDRVYLRDGIAYGAEIKNTLKYIPLPEFQEKLRMCEGLKLRPLFISRFAPKTYNYRVIQAGGYAMLFGVQMYPFGFASTAERVLRILGLPVGCPSSVPGGTIQAFLNWHEKKLASENLSIGE
jgi:hypothetical protein